MPFKKDFVVSDLILFSICFNPRLDYAFRNPIKNFRTEQRFLKDFGSIWLDLGNKDIRLISPRSRVHVDAFSQRRRMETQRYHIIDIIDVRSERGINHFYHPLLTLYLSLLITWTDLLLLFIRILGLNSSSLCFIEEPIIQDGGVGH